jgi:hypothetical protein
MVVLVVGGLGELVFESFFLHTEHLSSGHGSGLCTVGKILPLDDLVSYIIPLFLFPSDGHLWFWILFCVTDHFFHVHLH